LLGARLEALLRIKAITVKTLVHAILAMALVFPLLGADDDLSRVSLTEAVFLASEFVKTNGSDISKLQLSGATLGRYPDWLNYWDVRWTPTNETSAYGRVELRVDMDKTVTPLVRVTNTSAQTLRNTAPTNAVIGERWIQSYFRVNGISNVVIKVGMKLEDVIKVLGKPTLRYEIWQEPRKGKRRPAPEDRLTWHPPSPMHVTPYISVRVERGVVTELKGGR
jgi:hypothetical protein